MKLRFKLFPIFLSITIIFLSVLQFSITVYAYSSGIHTDKDKATLNKFFEDGKYYATYWITQLGAIFSDFSFSKVMENKAAWEDYWNGENIIVDADSRTVTFSEDLMTAFKQALLEVAEEENDFFLLPTTDYTTMSPTMFKTSYAYDSFKNIVSESGCVVVSGERHSAEYFEVFRPFHTSSPISLVRANNLKFDNYCEVRFYDTYSWQNYGFNYRLFYTRYKDSDGYVSYKNFNSFDEGKEGNGLQTYAFIGWRVGVGSAPSGWTPIIYSTDGRKLKVFNSLNALKNYTAGSRSVYFGSHFYDEPAEITVSFDDLEKYIDGKYDQFFDDLKDLIGTETDNEDSLTEEDLENLVDKILDKMDQIGGGGGDNPDNPDKPDNPGGDNTGFLQGMLDTLSGYLDSILQYLDGILLQLGFISDQIEDLTVEAAEEKTDSLLSSIFSAFTEIGDMLKSKFPFSIPWDIYSMLSFFARGDPTEASYAAPASYFGDDSVMSYSSDAGLVVSYPGVGASVETLDTVDVNNYDDSDDIVLDNAGIVVFADGDHGGGGASRPGDSGDHGGGGSSRPGVGSHYDSQGRYHVAPFYEIPFQISQSMGIEGSVIIDLAPFQPISDISRTMFTCIFVMSLLNLTVHVIDALGDLFPS